MIKASEIAKSLGLDLIGDDVIIEQPSTLRLGAEKCLLFAKSFEPDLIDTINSCSTSFIIAHKDFWGYLHISHVLSEHPRLDFAKALNNFFVVQVPSGIAATAIISPTASIGKGVYIGEYVIVEDGAQIGDSTEIHHHVVVSRNCRIGKCCVIKSHTVIGQKGFGFEINEDDIPIAIPHLGAVRIGDYVEIGALNTVVAGTLADTTIGDYVKTDDHVHIAHNVSIGDSTLIPACAELSGSIKIGKRVWIGPNCSIINAITIGDGAFIGIGAVVTKSVEADMIVAGNPAKVLRKKSTP